QQGVQISDRADVTSPKSRNPRQSTRTAPLETTASCARQWLRPPRDQGILRAQGSQDFLFLFRRLLVFPQTCSLTSIHFEISSQEWPCYRACQILRVVPSIWRRTSLTTMAVCRVSARVCTFGWP